MAHPGKCLRVLELYSGIGGMHWALKESGLHFEVVMAVDINTTANLVYKHNFPSLNLHSFGIEKLTVKKLKSLGINAILMSPPCQPFTRVGKKGDCEDIRTKSFLHVLQLLKQLEPSPCYILVENVKGFEESETRQRLVETLSLCGYRYQEFLLSPLQFGIPNSRLRYYLIAKLQSKPFEFQVTDKLLTALPEMHVSQCDKCQNHSQVSHCPSTTPCSDSHNTSSSSPSHRSCCEENGEMRDVAETYSYGVKNSQVSRNTDQQEVHNDNGPASSCGEKVNISSFSTEASDDSLQDAVRKDITSCSDECSEQKFLGTQNFHSENLGTGMGKVCKPDTACLEDDLRSAGRNMRYCEEEDAMIGSRSRALWEYMETGSDVDFDKYLLSDKELRMFVVMDIVFPALKKSTCFTKRYGHYIEGAGSLVQMTTDIQAVRAASEFKSSVVELKNRDLWGEQELSVLRKLKLRYFTPREVANLLCFPATFGFPPDLSPIQMYRVLGNSLNVHVVAELIKLMTCGDTSSSCG